MSHYREIVERLKFLLKLAKKPYTTLVVGRINEAKLLNLPDLEAMVLVGCAETSVLEDKLLDTTTKMMPIVTPYEMECALAVFTSSPSAAERDESGKDKPSRDHRRRIWLGSRLPLDFSADILDSSERVLYLRLFV